MSGMKDLLHEGLSEQADVEPYGEGTVTITGPIDLEALSLFIDLKMRDMLMAAMQRRGMEE